MLHRRQSKPTQQPVFALIMPQSGDNELCRASGGTESALEIDPTHIPHRPHHRHHPISPTSVLDALQTRPQIDPSSTPHGAGPWGYSRWSEFGGGGGRDVFGVAGFAFLGWRIVPTKMFGGQSIDRVRELTFVRRLSVNFGGAWTSLGIVLVLHRHSVGAPLVLLWYYIGTMLLLRWCCPGFVLVLC